ncbi:MAG: hypothetical protein HY819_22435 [Acidobacteria bacterium]|nr:hypothetical protein [Acidobacteriota bacterium]
MSNCYAVLLDSVSIQKYIFASNKLIENLGASYLVKEIYKGYLANALSKVSRIALEEVLNSLDYWEKSDLLEPTFSKVYDIGYIGGGNALLFFEKEELAHKFIEEWTKLLLIETPELTTAVACFDFPKTSDKFCESLQSLYTKLKENKSKSIPINYLLKHGITAECIRSGSSSEVYNEHEKTYLSAATNAKLEAARLSKKEVEEIYKEELTDRFCFSNKLEELGSILGEDSHIAIVHIDGNSMGERFKAAPSLKAMRELSKTVELATKQAFKAVIKETVKDYDAIMQSLGFDRKSNDPTRKYPKSDNKYILPIRPIILGGDDVTFVCDGKLGIYFAKIFIEAFMQEKVSDGKDLTACAGIAIIKTKYPFYRGVRLAEELCRNAKKERKISNSSDSFLDFQISLGSLAGKLSDIRLHFEVPQGNLLYRPFKIVPKDQDKSLEMFLNKVAELYKVESNLPNNKLNELREVLSLSNESAKKFLQQLKIREEKLPEIEGHQYSETLFEGGKTPYFDMIELGKFYPIKLIKLKDSGAKK